MDLHSNSEAEHTPTSPEIGREGRFADTPAYQPDSEDFKLSAFSDRTMMSRESTGKRHRHHGPRDHKTYGGYGLDGEDDSPLTKRICRNGRIPDIGRHSSPISSTSKEMTDFLDKTDPQLPRTPISAKSSPVTSSALRQRSISEELETSVKELPKQRVPPSDLQGALASLGPGQRLSATAIELTLAAACSSDEVHIFDPLWFDVAKASLPIHVPKIPSSTKYILLPLYHNAKQHWTIAIFDLRTFTIHHYDSLSSTWNPLHKETLLVLANSMVPLCSSEYSSEWTAERGAIARQTNAHDCGIFTIIAAVYTVGGLEHVSDPDCMQWRIALKALVGGGEVEADLRRITTLFDNSAIAENSHGLGGSDSLQDQTQVALQELKHSIAEVRKAQTGLRSAAEITKIVTVLAAKRTDTLLNVSDQQARLQDESTRYETFVHSHSEFPSFTNEDIVAALRLNLNAGKRKLHGLRVKLDKAQAQTQQLEAMLTVAQQLSERYRDRIRKLDKGAKDRQARVRQLKTKHQNALQAIEETEEGAGWLDESNATMKINEG